MQHDHAQPRRICSSLLRRHESSRLGIGPLRADELPSLFSCGDHKIALADLVILSSDPAWDHTAYSKVRFTIRNGNVLYKER